MTARSTSPKGTSSSRPAPAPAAKAAAAAPAKAELKTETEEPKAPAAAQETKEIQTDVRAKLAKKTDAEDIFVPTNPASLEKAAARVAEEQEFELTRGTAIGARLIAKSRNMA